VESIPITTTLLSKEIRGNCGYILMTRRGLKTSLRVFEFFKLPHLFRGHKISF
jgi:hypothetical protein